MVDEINKAEFNVSLADAELRAAQETTLVVKNALEKHIFTKRVALFNAKTNLTKAKNSAARKREVCLITNFIHFMYVAYLFCYKHSGGGRRQ